MSNKNYAKITSNGVTVLISTDKSLEELFNTDDKTGSLWHSEFKSNIKKWVSCEIDMSDIITLDI